MNENDEKFWQALRYSMSGPKCKYVLDQCCRELGDADSSRKLRQYVNGLENNVQKLLLAKDREIWKLRQELKDEKSKT